MRRFGCAGTIGSALGALCVLLGAVPSALGFPPANSEPPLQDERVLAILADYGTPASFDQHDLAASMSQVASWMSAVSHGAYTLTPDTTSRLVISPPGGACPTSDSALTDVATAAERAAAAAGYDLARLRTVRHRRAAVLRQRLR